MKLPTVRDFCREFIEEFEEHVGYRPSRKERRELLIGAVEKHRSMMEAYGEWTASPSCECGLDDVTTETCPAHRGRV